jgi:Transcription factor WhiB
MAADAGPCLIPPGARGQWLALTSALEANPTVPCRVQDPESWWPDRKDLDSATTHGAVAGCRHCPVAGECLDYALAADERFGIWGGRLPDERKSALRA